MSVYRFGRYGVFLRDDHPLAIYAGKIRLSPHPKLVWWWPWNWAVVVALLPVATFSAIRKAFRRHPTTGGEE